MAIIKPNNNTISAITALPSGLDTVEKVNAKEFPTKPSGE